MLDKKVSKLLNEQINKELFSAYLYLDMSSYFEARGLNGFANWYMIQAQQGEEETNANDMITKMELFGSDPKGLYMLNQELAGRTYSAPSLVLD